MDLQEAKQVLQDELTCRPLGDKNLLEAIRVALHSLNNDIENNIDIKAYNFDSSINIIAGTSIDMWQNTPLINPMYNRKLYCEDYVSFKQEGYKEDCIRYIKNSNEIIKQLLNIHS